MKSEIFATWDVRPFSDFTPLVNPGIVDASLSPGTYDDIRRSFVKGENAGSTYWDWFHLPMSVATFASAIDGVFA